MDYKILIKKRIKEKYHTIANFSNELKIPRQTINYILKTGIESSSYGTISKILRALDIINANGMPIIFDKKVEDLLNKYSMLDEYGKHTIHAVAETEWQRLHPDNSNISAAYGSLADNESITDNDSIILNLTSAANEKNK